MNARDGELLVSMDAPTGKLQGEHEYDVKCRAAGVRPPPIVTWWLRGNRLTENVDVQSLGPDSTLSLLRLLTTPGDDGGILECRASSPTLPHLTASDSTELTVYCEYCGGTFFCFSSFFKQNLVLVEFVLLFRFPARIVEHSGEKDRSYNRNEAESGFQQQLCLDKWKILEFASIIQTEKMNISTGHVIGKRQYGQLVIDSVTAYYMVYPGSRHKGYKYRTTTTNAAVSYPLEDNVLELVKSSLGFGQFSSPNWLVWISGDGKFLSDRSQQTSLPPRLLRPASVCVTCDLRFALFSSPEDSAGRRCRRSVPALLEVLLPLSKSVITSVTLLVCGPRVREEEHVPKATISIDAGSSSSSLDSGLPSSGLREGSSATLTCVTRANPPVYNLTFMFNAEHESVLYSGYVITDGVISVAHNVINAIWIQNFIPNVMAFWAGRNFWGPYQQRILFADREFDRSVLIYNNNNNNNAAISSPVQDKDAPVCAWRGEREILAVVNEKVKMNCYMKASPSHVTFDWTTSHKESALRHQDKGLSSEGWVMAANVSGNGMNQWVKCSATNDVGGSSHPCVFSISLVEPPSQLVGCAYHEVTTDSAAVTCSAGSTSEKLTPTYHIEVREGNTVILTKNSSKPRFNLSTLSPGRDYVLAMYASQQKGRGKETTLLLRTPTPKAEEVAPERVSINLNNEPSSDILQPDGDVEEGSGLPVNAIVGGAAAVAIGLAGVVAAIVFCRAHRSQNNSRGKSQQFHHASHDSLLELPHGTMYQPCTRHPSRELLTTFSPGPVAVTQVTSGRSSIRSSPLPRRSSTRSAPGGTSLRRHRPRTPSVRGGPVHVVEVESDSITTPRVEIESPSKSLASIQMSLRGDTSEVRQSPPLSLPCDTLEPPATPAPNEMSQSLLPTDFNFTLLTTQADTVPQTLVPSNIFTTPYPYNTASQICASPQVHVVTAAPDIITSQAPPTQTQIQNTPQIHIVSEDHLASHIQDAPQVLRVHEPLMHPEALQQTNT
ncbi:uncharacterized protein [Palaemon carinicauda]|uniref:uncharacterized protein n=1 Tax=Palaemon carinicauda TaxID=392227 RepID=UPI0035B61684